MNMALEADNATDGLDVGADSLVVSVPKYSATALTVTRVQFLS